MQIEILDLGINNLTSLELALRRIGSNSVNIIQDANQSRNANLFVLPGVGAFGAAVEELDNRFFRELLGNAKNSGVGIVGICLGMQLLGDNSEETSESLGLELIPGISKILPKTAGMKIPNVGWYSTQLTKREFQFTSLNSCKDFYFVHSYEFIPENKSDILCVSNYGNHKIVSGVQKENVIGFQFHPEKSADIGGLLLEEVLEWANAKN